MMLACNRINATFLLVGFIVCNLCITLRQVKYKIKVEAKFSNAHEIYFGIKIGDQAMHLI